MLKRIVRMNRRINRIKDYFTFSRGERLGIIVLLFIIVLLLFLPMAYRKYLRKEVRFDSNIQAVADSFFASLKDIDDDAPRNTFRIEQEEAPLVSKSEEFPFDPNTATLRDFVRLGFSEKQAQVILRYRSKGGAFASPKDFSKMYVVDSATFKRLKPYITIHIPSSTKPLDTVAKAHVAAVFVPVCINTADTMELTRVKGIGKTFAKRIVNYRTLLGGFQEANQLTEVYGITTEAVEQIAPQISVDASLIKPINLNTVSYDELRKHPYITDYQAKAIIYYRSKVTQIRATTEVVENNLISKEDFSRIKNYLSID